MFKQLKIYYIFISLPFVLLLVGAAIFAKAINLTLVNNPHPQINYTIFTIILVGGALILLNASRLLREARVIVEFFAAVHGRRSWPELHRLANSYTVETACLLQMVSTSGGRHISHQEQVAIENELTNTRSRLLRRNALPQYLTGLLVGMGLLGTFIGLLATLNDITILISSFADLDMQNASPLLVFRTMIERMKAPMASMAIAFSASMFGLLGSIILGLMMVGIRRLQGDMFSVLSSEVGRHIENALAHDGITSSSSSVAATDGGDAGEVAKVLIRIEERYAEAARTQQRAFTAVIDDHQKQRTDMLRILTEQTEASNSSRMELQNLGRQMECILNALVKNGGELSEQFSELNIQLAGNTRETYSLLAAQIEEQKTLRKTLDSYRIEERLAESTRAQQRLLVSEIDDFQQQRAEMLRALNAQTEANNRSRVETQQLGSQLENICNALEKGNGELSSQVSELTIHLTANAKESQLQIEQANSNMRSEIQLLGRQLDNSFNLMGQSNGEVCARISALIERITAEARKSNEQVELAGGKVLSALQDLGQQLNALSQATEQNVAFRANQERASTGQAEDC